MRTVFTIALCWVLGVVTVFAQGRDGQSPFNFQFGPSGGFGGGGGELELTGQFQVAAGKREGRLSITAQVLPGWHVYSVTQLPGGPMKSELQVPDSERFELAGPFEADVPPTVKQYEFFDVPVEEHSDKVTWTAPIRLAPGVKPEELTPTVSFKGQVCQDDGACIPIQRDVTIKFAGYYRQATPTGQYRAPRTHVTIGGHIVPQVASPGSTVKLVLTAKPDADWHIYRYAERDPKKTSKPTLIAITKPSSWPVGAPQASSEPLAEEIGLADEPIIYYHESDVSWTVEVQIPADAEPGQRELAGLIGYQTCKSSGCDAPTGAAFTATFTIASRSVDEPVPLAFSPADYAKAAAAAESQLSRAAVTSTKSDFDDKPLAVIFGMAFLAGLILNVMPCVLPVIGLKIMAFVQQAGESRIRVFALNLAYSLGLLVVFWILATTAFFLQVGWGDQFSNAGFNIVLASIVFVFGLSLLGVWEVPIPGFIGGNKANEMAEREGAFGAFCKGMLTTVLATPCTGPFLGPAIGWAIKQEAWLNYSTFTVVGLGMAAPYLLIGAFPQLIRILPRPGAWMNTFKQVMGFVLMGTVVFIFFFLEEKYTIPALALLVALGFACWLVGRTPITASSAAKVRAWVGGASFAVLTALMAFYFVPNVLLAHELPWVPYTRASLDEQLANGNTVLVDFTADW